ncbi:MAG: S8 family peptidase [Euryarchaeota archaeon]|nr:S8 family peptidase [Euryarchaeota archaeon]
MPNKYIQEIGRNPKVELIEYDTTEIFLADEIIPWGAEKIGATTCWSNGVTGNDVVIAIVDGGVDYNHPDLKDNYIGGYDFADNDNDPMDYDGHGTNCAGAALAKKNGFGTVGIAPGAKLLAVKVFRQGGSSLSTLIAGIDYAVQNKADVISMSFILGSSYSYASLAQACQNAYIKGVVLVASAGNHGSSGVFYPAKYPTVIAVGATDSNNKIAWFSSIGPEVELVAPGIGIYTTAMNNKYEYVTGTSISAPQVAGVVALMRGINPSLSPDEIRKILRETAEDLGTLGKDDYYGYGLVDADEALSRVVASPTTTTTSTTTTTTTSTTTSISVTTTSTSTTTTTIPISKPFRSIALR